MRTVMRHRTPTYAPFANGFEPSVVFGLSLNLNSDTLSFGYRCGHANFPVALCIFRPGEVLLFLKRFMTDI